MFSQNLREELRKELANNPEKVVKTIEHDPKLLEYLLKSEEERIKYINMSHEMELKLKETASKLKVTQGLLIGAGVLLLLALLDDE